MSHSSSSAEESKSQKDLPLVKKEESKSTGLDLSVSNSLGDSQKVSSSITVNFKALSEFSILKGMSESVDSHSQTVAVIPLHKYVNIRDKKLVNNIRGWRNDILTEAKALGCAKYLESNLDAKTEALNELKEMNPMFQVPDMTKSAWTDLELEAVKVYRLKVKSEERLKIKAFLIAARSLGNNTKFSKQFEKQKESDCAYTLFSAIIERFDKKDVHRLNALQKEFMDLKMEKKETMDEYIARSRNIVDLLNDHNDYINNSLVVQRIFKGLPSSYQTFCQTVLMINEQNLLSDDEEKSEQALENICEKLVSKYKEDLVISNNFNDNSNNEDARKAQEFSNVNRYDRQNNQRGRRGGYRGRGRGGSRGGRTDRVNYSAGGQNNTQSGYRAKRFCMICQLDFHDTKYCKKWGVKPCVICLDDKHSTGECRNCFNCGA